MKILDFSEAMAKIFNICTSVEARIEDVVLVSPLVAPPWITCAPHDRLRRHGNEVGSGRHLPSVSSDLDLKTALPLLGRTKNKTYCIQL